MVEAMLNQLALLFLASTNGDTDVARQIAAALLIAYKPNTEPELTLTGAVIHFGCHATQSLVQACAPDLPLGMVIRLRASAVSLHREALRSYQKLEQLQRERRALADQTPPEPVAPEQPQPVQAAREPVPAEQPAAAEPVPPRPAPASADSYAHLSKEAIRRLSPAQQKRIYLARMTDTARRRQAEQAALSAARNGGELVASDRQATLK
jgi:localization factor PodJL